MTYAKCYSEEDALAFLKLKHAPPWSKGSTKPTRIVDLFCGCGGMSLGLAAACFQNKTRFQVAGAIDTDTDAVALYQRNVALGASVDEIGSLLAPFAARTTARERAFASACGQVDVLLGGPPCQGNSDLNNHTRREDPRNELYFSMARAAELLQPGAVIVENVPTVIHGSSNVVERTVAALLSIGYDVSSGIEHLTDFGVPQRRRRHILLAIKSAPSGTASKILHRSRIQKTPRTVRWAIQDLVGTPLAPGLPNIDSPSKLSEENTRRLKWLLHNDEYVLPNTERPPCHRDKPHSYKSVYGRMRWDEPSQTITTGFGSMGQGCYVHPDGERLITPHEAARIQTFPDFFEFSTVPRRTSWSRAIGNAVPPMVMAAIGSELLKHLHSVRG